MSLSLLGEFNHVPYKLYCVFFIMHCLDLVEYVYLRNISMGLVHTFEILVSQFLNRFDPFFHHALLQFDAQITLNHPTHFYPHVIEKFASYNIKSMHDKIGENK